MGKTVLITGCSTGIGRASAKFFQQKGWNVVASMRSPEKEQELSGLENVLVTRLDVQDEASIQQAVKATLDAFGKIDVVVNNAGYALTGAVEAVSRQQIANQFEVNVLGLFAVTQAVLTHFRENRAGMFINISSVGGKITFPLLSLYHSTKFAVEGFSESFRYEVEPFGIGVKIVEPGGVATDFGTRSMVFAQKDIADYREMAGKVQASFANRQGQQATSELVAETIFQAATDGSDRLRYVVGEDAKQLLEARKNMSDSDMYAMMKKQMGL